MRIGLTNPNNVFKIKLLVSEFSIRFEKKVQENYVYAIPLSKIYGPFDSFFHDMFFQIRCKSHDMKIQNQVFRTAPSNPWKFATKEKYINAFLQDYYNLVRCP